MFVHFKITLLLAATLCYHSASAAHQHGLLRDSSTRQQQDKKQEVTTNNHAKEVAADDAGKWTLLGTFTDGDNRELLEHQEDDTRTLTLSPGPHQGTLSFNSWWYLAIDCYHGNYDHGETKDTIKATFYAIGVPLPLGFDENKSGSGIAKCWWGENFFKIPVNGYTISYVDITTDGNDAYMIDEASYPSITTVTRNLEKLTLEGKMVPFGVFLRTLTTSLEIPIATKRFALLGKRIRLTV